jgi:hypothetical protein
MSQTILRGKAYSTWATQKQQVVENTHFVLKYKALLNFGGQHLRTLTMVCIYNMSIKFI